MNDVLLYERDGAVARITLNRPSKLNALNRELVNELDAAIDRAAADDSIKIVVVEGAGGNFSAGYDLAEEAADQISGHLEWHDLLGTDIDVTLKLWELPKPTIAVVRGWCLAGACEIAMACDMVMASSEAKFGEPEIRYGSGPVTLIMPFVLGQKKTNELLFTGDVIGASEAERIGMITRAIADEALDAAVDELIRKIAPTPLPVLRLTKMALTRAYAAKGLVTAVRTNLDLSAMLNGADTPEQREFDAIVSTEGLRAALAWRDSRYGGPLTSDSAEQA